MSDRPRAGRSDGVTIAPGSARGKSIALLAGAVALACIALLVLFGRPETRSDAPQTTPETSQAPPPVAAPSPIEPGAVAAPADEAPAPGASVLPKAPPPPGTEPLKMGIVVPDDFELPEGYLRHTQVTDDGQELEPILLFHPDYQVFDENGEPMELPQDRIVPPELAPPGMPIRMLEPPAPLEPE